MRTPVPPGSPQDWPGRQLPVSASSMAIAGRGHRQAALESRDGHGCHSRKGRKPGRLTSFGVGVLLVALIAWAALADSDVSGSFYAPCTNCAYVSMSECLSDRAHEWFASSKANTPQLNEVAVLTAALVCKTTPDEAVDVFIEVGKTLTGWPR